MSLGRIAFYSMALGLVVGLLASGLGAALDREVPATSIGMVTSFLSVVVAGRIHPVPPKRR